jgi:HlyD family secretion protein
MVESPAPFVEVRSDEVNELLARQPSWLLRWSTTLIFLTLGLVFLGTWMVHYPEIVQAPLTLVSVNAPKEVVARAGEKLLRVQVREGASVAKGTRLAYLESTANPAEVERLAQTLATAWRITSAGRFEDLDQLKLTDYRELGEVQNDYQTFINAYIQLRAYFAAGYYAKKKALQAQELADLVAIARNLAQQQQLQQHDLALAQEEFAVQQKLAEQRVIASLDLKREESRYMARRLPAQQTQATLLANQNAQHAKAKEMLELDKTVAEQHDSFLQAINTLQSTLRAWEYKYVITAPIAGKVTFPRPLQEGQQLSVNQALFFIAPPNSEFTGEIRLPQQNSGRVHTGQQVLIKLAGFPYQEFGLLTGRITDIADIPLKDNVFVARVSLPAGLTTTYGKRLAYRTGMTASAEIITQDRRLLERIFLQLQGLLHK